MDYWKKALLFIKKTIFCLVPQGFSKNPILIKYDTFVQFRFTPINCYLGILVKTLPWIIINNEEFTCKYETITRRKHYKKLIYD